MDDQSSRRTRSGGGGGGGEGTREGGTSNQATGAGGPRSEFEFVQRERDLLRREADLILPKNKLLTATPRSSITKKHTIRLRTVGELLSTFSRRDRSFQNWKEQLSTLCSIYELDDNSAKLLRG